MFNLITAMLFAIIDIAEPAIEDDDTAQFTPIVTEDDPPVLHTSAISLVGLHSLDQLCGALVLYRPDNFSEPQIGNIAAWEEGKFGRVSLYFVPKDETLCPKWRDLSDFVYAVWS